MYNNTFKELFLTSECANRLYFHANSVATQQFLHGRAEALPFAVAYPELVSRGVSKTRKFKWLVKVGASIYQTPDLKKNLIVVHKSHQTANIHKSSNATCPAILLNNSKIYGTHGTKKSPITLS